jgi:hypothetical protein
MRLETRLILGNTCFEASALATVTVYFEASRAVGLPNHLAHRIRKHRLGAQHWLIDDWSAPPDSRLRAAVARPEAEWIAEDRPK